MLQFRFPAGGEAAAVEGAEEKEQRSPPDAGVKMIEHDGMLRGMGEFIKTRSENQ